MNITLVIGLPGTGKTTYVKEKRGDALVFDLDYLKTALTYSDVHSPNDIDAMKVANSFLSSFVTTATERERDCFIIRTAPKMDELQMINPSKMVVMLKEYDISNRADYHDDVDRELYNTRIQACIKWCEKHGVELELKE